MSVMMMLKMMMPMNIFDHGMQMSLSPQREREIEGGKVTTPLSQTRTKIWNVVGVSDDTKIDRETRHESDDECCTKHMGLTHIRDTPCDPPHDRHPKNHPNFFFIDFHLVIIFDLKNHVSLPGCPSEHWWQLLDLSLCRGSNGRQIKAGNCVAEDDLNFDR